MPPPRSTTQASACKSNCSMIQLMTRLLSPLVSLSTIRQRASTSPCCIGKPGRLQSRCAAAGLESATGEFIAIFDADFCPHPDISARNDATFQRTTAIRHDPDTLGSSQRRQLLADRCAGDSARQAFRDGTDGAPSSSHFPQIQRIRRCVSGVPA